MISGLGRSPGEGNGNPLQYSCLENPMDGGAWWATVQGVAKSQTRLSDFTFPVLHLAVSLFVIGGLPPGDVLQWYIILFPSRICDLTLKF